MSDNTLDKIYNYVYDKCKKSFIPQKYSNFLEDTSFNNQFVTRFEDCFKESMGENGCEFKEYMSKKINDCVYRVHNHKARYFVHEKILSKKPLSICMDDINAYCSANCLCGS